jgi:chemotaxis signal transduction protein
VFLYTYALSNESMTNLPFTSRYRDLIRELTEMSDQDFVRYAEQCASHSNTLSPISAEEYLICQTDKGSFIMRFSDLQEVTLPPKHSTTLPSSPFWMAGLSAWQNEVIATVNFAAYASQIPSTTHPTHMLVISHDTMAIGLLLNVVDFITNLPSASLQPLETLSAAYTTFPCPQAIQAVYEDKLVLAVEPLFTHILHAIQGRQS